MKKLHLICNAHLDPIWLWKWEEGASAALSTFRSAAKLAEEFDYIFCHNEVTLYKWVLEYEPELFERIQRLVKEGKWHIMGGWYLQPDCNMPSGESFVRQALVGQKFFKKYFDKTPTTAINFDPFGHTRGLVQILSKCGYDSYIFCRPFPNEMALASEEFIWKGFDGSTVKASRGFGGYLSVLGKATEKIEEYIKSDSTRETGMVLWGVGNHGGGPSRQDLNAIKMLMEKSETEIIHSTPEDYFKEFHSEAVVEKSLYPSMIGCYSSQVLIKQKHIELESEYYVTERMCATAELLGLITYPTNALDEAMEDLLNAQFHDILPGSSIKDGEMTGLRLMDHGLEILSRIRAKAFFALTAGQEATKPGEYTVLVYNPHPFDITQVVECEFQLEEQNHGDDFTTVEVYFNDSKIPSQIVKEKSNINLDWRKCVQFYGTLKASSMSRFDCRVHRIEAKLTLPTMNSDFCFNNEMMQVKINAKTGLIDSLCVDGKEFLQPNSFAPIIISDNEDPWAVAPKNSRLGEKIGEFKLMTEAESTEFSGMDGEKLAPVRIIEDGEVSAVVEAVFGYRNSSLVANYILAKNSKDFEVKYTVFWNEKNKAMKVFIPTKIEDASYIGETAYGIDNLEKEGKEVVSQRWLALTNKEHAFAVINNCCYASSCEESGISLTLLRSPCYAAYPIGDRPLIPKDRYVPRIDQGERSFHFSVSAGNKNEILPTIGRQAQVFYEPPYALNVFPNGSGEKTDSFITVSNPSVQLTTFKKADTNGYIIRLFNCSGEEKTAVVEMAKFGLLETFSFGAFEVKTLRFSGDGLVEVVGLEI